MTSDPLVTFAHVRKARLCAKGAREWFKRYGLSYSEFVTKGLPASVLEATGDHFASIVCKIARDESAGEADHG